MRSRRIATCATLIDLSGLPALLGEKDGVKCVWPELPWSLQSMEKQIKEMTIDGE
jgi:hypothetical protein